MADLLSKVRPNAVLEGSEDDSRMYAEFAASVPEVDTDGEIVFPEEFDLSVWNANPVWLWAHDPKSLPIGQGQTSDGQVAAWVTPEMLRLGCQFSQVNPNGPVVYGMYKEKTLRMVSVGFRHGRPIAIPGKQYGVDGMVHKIPEPLLMECSCLPMGANLKARLLTIKGMKDPTGYYNPDAIAVMLDKGHFHGEKITPELSAFLRPFAGERKKSFVSFPNLRHSVLQFSTFKGPDMASIAKKDTQSKEDDKVTLGFTSVEAYEKYKSLQESAKSAQAETVKADGAAVDAEKVLPTGMQTLKSFAEMAVGGCKGMAEMMAASDSEDAKAGVMGLCNKLADLVGEAYELGVKMFPDHVSELEEMATEAMTYASKAEDEGDEASSTADDGEETKEDDTDVYEEEDAEEADSEMEEEDNVEKSLKGWTVKAFGSDNPREAVLAWVKEAFPGVDLIPDIAAELQEITEGLEAAQEVLVGR